MFTDFFIKRPVFASVCALIIILVGAISIPTLPIAQFPDISPVQVNISANYQGATAETVENAVTTILERQINGVEGLKYLSSSSTNNGASSLTATFEAGRNKDLAAVEIQNRVATAEGQLPQAVQRTGVQVSKRSNNILMAIGLFAEEEQYDAIFLSNYADLYLVDALKRVEGVGDVRIFGERRYAMRLWLDPNRLASRGLTAQDVIVALQEQNLQVGAGRIGQQPSPPDQMYQLDLQAVSRLESAAEFEDIVIKTDENGTLVKLRDVGRAELGAQDYDSFLRFRGKEAVGLGIFQLPGSNALETATAVKAEIENLETTFPPGVQYQVAFDTTLYVEESMREVVMTLLLAIALVIFVIYFFLQDWRTTLIPAVTIPIALIGTFAFIKVFNFSINSLTLFGLTLATGMVVDDAIVVVENITRILQEKEVKPREATSEAMRELVGAVIATSLVLMAVFIPVAFFPGTTGALYRQFALTIAFSIALSTFIALTLTPSLAGLLLRRKDPPRGWRGFVFGKINAGLDKLTAWYARSLRFLSRIKSAVIGVFVLLLCITVWLYNAVPGSFLPEEDQGYFITVIQAPEGVSLNYTDQVMRQVEAILLDQPEVVATFAVGGFSFSGNASNSGVVFSPLTPWKERTDPSQSASAVIDRLRGELSQITEAQIFPVNPPTVRGLGNFGGFTFQLQDRRGGGDLQSFLQVMGQLLGKANQDPQLQGVFTRFSANAPQLAVEVDRNQAKALQVNIEDIFDTLQIYLGSRYVNDFTLAQRTYRVYVQADQAFRSNPEVIDQYYVRSATGQMIPLGNLITTTPTTSAQVINHYNLFRSIEITGSAADGYSSGDAIAAMSAVADETLPPGFGYEWSGSSLEEISSGGQAPVIFGLGLVFVFLVLAAQYENYLDPLIIMLAVPLAILGALLAVWLRGFSNDVYVQVGLVMLIGLASKNSILIVEFANQLRAQGLPIVKATLEASTQRLRPILMTAISTLFGIFPLVIATGAGSGSRQSLGTAVFGGMLVATFLSLFIVPILYIVIQLGSDKVKKLV
jgi:HAE1 family hydrophobic/amphiphilic exporter-1